MKTKSIVLLTMLLVLVAALTSCFLFGEVEHTWVEATCTSPRTCSFCGETEGEALGHTEEVISGTPATCTTVGYTDGKICTVCNEVTVAQEEIPALGHTEEVIPGKAATCTEKGLTEGKKCSVCEEILLAQEEVPEHGHTEEVVPGKAATCTATGLTDGKKCSVCDETLVAQEEIPMAAHTEEVVPGKAATCTETGLTDGKKCSVCGETLVAQEEIKALGHTEEVVAGKAATCTETGLTDGKKCSVCGETLVAQEEIKALGHTEEVVPGKAATCTATGLTDGKKCSVCGETLVAQEEIPMAAHTEEVVPGKAATCTATGLTDGKKCSVCGETLVAQEEIPMAAHTEEAVAGKDATCTETGLTDGKKCSVCGETLVAQEEIPMAAHTEEVVPGKAASCIENGLTDGKKCSVCGATLLAQENINALGHKDENGDFKCDVCGEDLCTEHVAGEAVEENRVEATCTTEGSYDLVVKCSVCGDELSRDHKVIPVIDHTEEVVPGKAATCTETGLTDGKKCSVCGATLLAQEEIPMAAHTEEVVAGKDATCTETGLTEGKKCSVCGEVLVAQEEIPVIPHTEEVVAGKAATCTETGLTEGKKCSVCGEVLVAQEEIPALDHAYGEASYVWSGDNSVCTASKVCANDPSHVISESATVISVKVQASAEKVIYTYNVEFVNSDFAAQSKSVEGAISIENKIATVNAPAIAGRVASHDYVKFSFHNAEAIHEFTIYYSEIDVWDGTSVSESLAGSGTLEDPYLIQSAADFAYLAAQLNNAAVGQTQNFEGQYFKMTKSIDLNGNLLIAGNHSGWNKYQGFGGTFDGNNCSIRGINVEPTTGTSSALFGCITAAGTLKNLIVYGNAKGAGTVGGVVAYQLGAVDNVTSYVTVIATAGTIGGVVANQESSAGILSNCVNYGSVTSTSYIVGGVAGSGGATITNCVNWGNVQAGAEKAGGIAGETKNAGIIEGCTNYGNITMTVAGKGYVGGIAGNAVKPISNCVNYGTITGVNTTGGIAGLSTALVDNCVNYGTVNASSWNIGGISGRASGGIQNSINYADVTSTASGTVGGIVGTAQSNISGCENRGTVKGSGQCGGIVGVFNTNSNITDCVNYGEVNGAWATGGIAGYSKAGTSTISGCENHGKILCSTTSNGGIVGLVSENAIVTVSDCINRGDVSGVSWGGGGIAGEIVAGSISGCTNYGSVSGQGQLGGIVGKSKVNVSGCINYGKITATVDIAAGICADTTGEIANCENNGEIIVNCTCVNVDGISPSDVTKTECVNNGTITINHSLTHVDAVAPTCKEAGIVAHEHCSACGKNFDAEGNQLESVEDPILDHTEEVVPGYAATCTESGLTDGKKCSACGETLVAQEEIPAAHKDENNDFICDVCDTSLCDHITETLKENVVEVTCEADGSYDTVVKCTKCGAEISRETVTVDALGHAYEIAYVWAEDNSSCTASSVCGNDASHVINETAIVPSVLLNVSATKVTYTYKAVFTDNNCETQTKVVEADVTLANNIATINAPAFAGRTASHEYVKFGFHDAAATYEFTIYYSEIDTWDGTSVSESLQGSGTEEDPYLVQSAADLAYIAKVVNEAAASTANFKGQYFKMTKSIDLGGKALMIGSYSGSKVFHGFFDGNNCAIKGINATQSLFGMLKDGYIKNLSTYGSVTTAEKKGVAGVVSYVSGATVENVTNYANVTGVQQVAGVVGWLENNTTSIANNCVNYGNVVATSYQNGGIAGFAKGTLTNCTNFGDVTSTASGYVGGIGGAAKDAKGSRSNCVNYGNVSATSYIGGCFGQINKTTTDCYSYGTATLVSGTATTVGDVVGSGASYLTYTAE